MFELATQDAFTVHVRQFLDLQSSLQAGGEIVAVKIEVFVQKGHFGEFFTLFRLF
jgi:hypothetical protein